MGGESSPAEEEVEGAVACSRWVSLRLRDLYSWEGEGVGILGEERGMGGGWEGEG